MKRPEQELQKACVKWFRLQYPNAIIHHSPNGGKRAGKMVLNKKTGRMVPIEGRILKSMGVMAGFPDLMILHDGRVLFVEMKSDKGKLNDNQQACLVALADAGFATLTCRGFEDFQKIVNEFIQQWKQH